MVLLRHEFHARPGRPVLLREALRVGDPCSRHHAPSGERSKLLARSRPHTLEMTDHEPHRADRRPPPAPRPPPPPRPPAPPPDPPPSPRAHPGPPPPSPRPAVPIRPAPRLPPLAPLPPPPRSRPHTIELPAPVPHRADRRPPRAPRPPRPPRPPATRPNKPLGKGARRVRRRAFPGHDDQIRPVQGISPLAPRPRR